MTSERSYERQLKRARYNLGKLGSEFEKILSPVREKSMDSEGSGKEESGGFFLKSIAFFRAKFRR